MSELRYDDLSGVSVLIAPGRAARPRTVAPAASPAAAAPADCPFCPGHEPMTPPEVFRAGEGDPDTPGWRVRVVPNLYPFVGGPDARDGATGAHEVVALSPEHNATLADLDDVQTVELFGVLRDRASQHLANGHAFVQVLVNEGREAGASIAHPHAQIVALDFVPDAVRAHLEHFDQAGVDLVAQTITKSAGAPTTVLEGPAFAWCPAASWTGFHVRVAARSTRARFDEASNPELRAVALAIRDVLARLQRALGPTPYNLVVHSAPPGLGRSYHWYVDIMPRRSTVAGFEIGTGVLINTVDPVAAAQMLRDAS